MSKFKGLSPGKPLPVFTPKSQPSSIRKVLDTALSLNKDFTYKYPPDTPTISGLTCSVCRQILTDPLEASCCFALSCASCVSRHRCHSCRSNSPVLKPNVPVKRLINSLPISCNFCQHSTLRGQFDEHLLTCELRPLTCKFCSEIVLPSSALDHVKLHPQEVIKFVFS
ncbi:hypothetical protein RCL1_003308 [Eukaryota sp. TZLM3-RCL]